MDGVAKVDKDKCTGCGACANICPKKVIMIDVGGPRKPVVMCSLATDVYKRQGLQRNTTAAAKS